MKMHYRVFEKMRSIFFGWNSYLGHVGPTWGLASTSKMPSWGKSNKQKKQGKPMLFSPSEDFKPSILFHRGSDWPTLGPPDFSEEKCKGPMAPPSEKHVEITMKMHCQDFEKMCYLVFVKFLSWPSWANSEIGFDLSTSKMPISGKSKTQGKPLFSFTFWGLQATHTCW